MKIRLYRTIFLALAALLIDRPLVRAQNADPDARFRGLPVREIRIESSPWLDSAALETALGIARESPYAPEKLVLGIERILAWESVSEVLEPRVELQGDGMVLGLEVRAHRSLRTLNFSGNDALDDEALRDDLGLRPGAYIRSGDIEAGRRRILEKYHDDGFLLVHVETRTEDVEGFPELVDVEYIIQEARRTTIRSIHLSGNHRVPSRQLLSTLKHRRRVLFGLVSRGYYVPRDLPADLERLRTFYRDRGYLDAEVYLDFVRFRRHFREVELGIGIQEGPRYRVAALRLEGQNEALTDALHQRIRSRPDTDLDGKLLEEDRRRLQSFYQTETLRVPEIQTRLVVRGDADDHRVEVLFMINERRHLYVGRLDVSGNVGTRDHVIRTRVTPHPAGALTAVEIRESANRVFGTGLLEGAEVETALAPTANLGPSLEARSGDSGLELGDVRDVELEVQEKERTGHFEVGGGASSGEGEVAALIITQPNFDLFDLPGGERGWKKPFSGGGQTLRLEVFPGSKISEFKLILEEPYVYNSYHGASLRGSNQIFRWRSLDEVHLRGAIGLKRFWDAEKHFSTRLSWVVRDVGIVNTDNDIPADAEEFKGHNFLSNPELVFAYSSGPSNAFSGPQGFHARSQIDVPAKGTGSEIEYFRTQTRMDYYWPLDELINRIAPDEPLDPTHRDTAHILRLGGQFGWMDGFSSKDTPYFDRFMLGGPRSFRGFEYRGLGRRENGVSLGGEAFWAGSVEVSAPVLLREIRAALLYDFGVLHERANFSSDKFRSAIGAGLRLRLSLLGQGLPINLYWVEALKKTGEDRERFFTFSIGYSF